MGSPHGALLNKTLAMIKKTDKKNGLSLQKLYGQTHIQIMADEGHFTLF